MGTYYVTATHADYTNETSTNVTLSTNGQIEIIDFALDPLPGSISGTVTDLNSGDPIQGVTAHCTNYNVTPAVELFWTYTNDAGNYNAPNVPAGTWYVVFELDHYKKDSVQVTVVANTTSTGNDIILEKAPGILNGVVTDAVTGAFLGSVSVDIIGDGLAGTSTVAADGSYEFDPALAGTYDVVFTKGGYTSQTIEDVVINATYTTTLNVTLQPDPGKIYVEITNSSIPNGDATVTIGNDYTAVFGVTTYNFNNMPVGTYDVTIEANGYHTATIEDVEVTSNHNTITTPITLEPYHYNYVTGSSIDDIWTIFLQGATIDGVPVEANDEIAIYDGSNLVGVYYIEEALTSWTATSHQLKAYSVITGGTGYTAGNTYTFKLWDNSAAAEYTATGVSLTDPNNEGAFTGTIFPTGINPISFANLTFNAEVTIDYALHTGYQIISSRVEATNMDMGTIMDNLNNKNNNLDYVKNEEGLQYRKIGGNWTNNIGDWGITEGYLVKMADDDNLSIEGIPQNAQTEIPLVAGYNLISFLPENALNAATAFNAIKDNVSFVRNSEGNHFWKIGGVWINNIGDLQPTEGYFVKMTAADTLVYPASKSGSSVKAQQLQHFNFISGDPTDAIYTIYATGANLNIGDEVAVFDGDKMVGAAVINSEKDAMVNNINVFNILPEGNGFTAGNSVTYKVWKQINNTEYGSIEVEYINPNGDAYTEGTFPTDDEHYSIAKLDAAELSINEEILQGLSLYPNPANDYFRLTSKNEIEKIKIISITGQVLREQIVNNNSVEINTNSFKAGIYIIESTIKQKRFVLRFAVK
ncbi:MAG: carboxypeptidase regulatory-like domain-containing protein [Bacteroidota bacterium]|nr:carboxypeptidase regulatory-like domain-containing protein [Bacteroidota bacterium]